MIKKDIIKKRLPFIIVGVSVLVGVFIIVNAYTSQTSHSSFNFTLERIFCKDCAISEAEQAFIDTVAEQELAGSLPQSTGGGLYTAYSPEVLKQQEEKKIVLFFKAEWCPSCRLLDAHLKAERDRIPKEVVILEIDYDTSRDLKIMYGITTQHSLVQVNARGEMIQKWVGGSTLESIVSQLE